MRTSLKCTSTTTSSSFPFPCDIKLWNDLKSLLNGLIKKLPVAKKFKTRLYDYSDFVIPKVYAMISHKSTEWATQTLNEALKSEYQYRFHRKFKTFVDGKRQRRIVPHQTSVDAFFRLLDESDVHNIFGNLLSAINQVIYKKYLQHVKVNFIVDDTEIAYYGSDRTDWEYGTHRPHMGTKKCRLLQGMAVQGAGLTLMTEIRLQKKKTYQSLHVVDGMRYAQWLGFNVSKILMDRGFYRANLVKSIKSAGHDFLMPIKKYPRVKKQMMDYLDGKRNVAGQYFFTTNSRATTHFANSRVWAVFIGNKGESAASLRKKYQSYQLSKKDALAKMSGFLTSLKPWKDLDRWARWLGETYKKRWNIETAFGKMNEMHDSFRNRKPVKQLIDYYIRAIIHNKWQAFKKEGMAIGVKSAHVSQNVFLEYLSDAVKGEIRRSIRQRLNYFHITCKEAYNR